MKNHFLFLILFSTFCSSLFAQENEVEDSLVFLRARNNMYLSYDTFKIEELKGMQNYRVWGANHLPVARSGNLGLAAHSLSLQNQDWSINSVMGGYQAYILTADSIRFYQVNRPVTELYYVNGAKTEQNFRVFHTQNLGDGLNISFNYNRMTSEGFFLRQLTNHTRFDFNYNAHSRNGRFNSRGLYVINNFKAQENGGIFISKNKENENNTVLLDINLYDAQNRGRSQEVFLENQYVVFQKDSATPLLSIDHQFSYARTYRNYKHDLSNSSKDFYPQNYFDTIYSRDSSYADVMRNQFGLSAINHRFYFGFRNENYHYFQNNLIDEKLNRNYLIGKYKDSVFQQQLALNFEQELVGSQNPETDFSARIAFQKMKTFSVALEGYYHKKQPDYFLEHYFSNQNFLNGDLVTTNTKGFLFQLKEEWSHIGLRAQFNAIENFVYFDSLTDVQQFNGVLKTMKIELNKTFTFWRDRLNLINKIIYQQFSNNEIVPLPELYSYHSFYYENHFFNNKLKVQLGTDFYYIGKYKGYNYSPSLTQFYLREDQNSLGNITQLDLFIVLGIQKSASLFVKFENVLSNQYSEDSYRINNYPIPGRAFKIGLSWRMLN